MPGEGAAKITISLRKELLALADELARERATTRSGVVADLLEKEARARIAALMEKGYRELAEENRILAEEDFAESARMLLETTEWDEEGRG